MEFGVLGPLRVVHGGDEIAIRRGNPRLILMTLILRVGETVGADVLAELLWGGEQPANPANALQTQISYLRRTLGAASPAAQPIVTRSGGYALDVSPDHVDAVRFQQVVVRARRLSDAGTRRALESAVQDLDDALGLWRGEPYADAAGHHFAVSETTRLVESRLTAQEARADCLLALGRHREAAVELAALVAEHPLRERFYELLVLAQYRCGRQAEALRTYERARELLLDELGLDPGPALQEIQRAVLEQSPSMEWKPPPDEAPVAVADHPQARQTRVRGRPPAPIGGLIGREADLRRVGDILERGRLVTVTGPGGAGKTSLALQMAAAGPGCEVWFVDLNGVEGDDFVPLAVATGIGAPTSPEVDPLESVVGVIGTSPALLVLDTCEHVIGGAARVASRLLGHLPQLRVLATSRRPLGVRGEMAWPLPPLGLPQPDMSYDELREVPSVALFVERAAALRPDFEMTERNAGDVAAICASLDGLPLAIELAAARIDTLSPAAIRSRLDDRFSLLVDGSRDAAERQQTLRSTIDWSYHLLDADERLLFVDLSVFAGPFGLDQASAVAMPDVADPLDALSGLVRQSMVAVVDEDHYQLLDTPREYGRALLAEREDAESVRERHARAYVELSSVAAQGLWSPRQQDFVAELRLALPNLRAAIEWAFASGQAELAGRTVGALSWFFMLEGMSVEGLAYLDRAERAGSELSRFARTWVAYGRGLLAAPLGRLDEARQACASCVELAREGGDLLSTANGLAALSVAEWAMGDIDSASAHQDESLELYEAIGDPWRKADILVLRARTAIDQGDPRAREMLERVIPLARSVGDLHASGMALAQLSLLALADGDHVRAAAAAEEALVAHEALNEPEATAGALHALGAAQLALGQPEKARALHARALDLAASIGHVGATCESVEDFAALAAAEGDPALAAALLSAADHERADRGVHRRPMDEARVGALRAAVAGATAPDSSLLPGGDFAKVVDWLRCSAGPDP